MHISKNSRESFIIVSINYSTDHGAYENYMLDTIEKVHIFLPQEAYFVIEHK